MATGFYCGGAEPCWLFRARLRRNFDARQIEKRLKKIAPFVTA